MDTLNDALTEIRSKAAELRENFGDEPRARALEWAAVRFEHALRQQADEHLTLSEASKRSGYSAEHIARLLRDGKLPNAGRRGAPRVRAGDLPARPQRRVVRTTPGSYDPIADARALLSRQGGNRE